jgi:hypothetical protein
MPLRELLNPFSMSRANVDKRDILVTEPNRGTARLEAPIHLSAKAPLVAPRLTDEEGTTLRVRHCLFRCLVGKPLTGARPGRRVHDRDASADRSDLPAPHDPLPVRRHSIQPGIGRVMFRAVARQGVVGLRNRRVDRTQVDPAGRGSAGAAGVVLEPR